MAPLEPFYPERLASRILGMGDIVSLVEKAQRTFTEEESIASMKKMRDATFDFNDFMEQVCLIAMPPNGHFVIVSSPLLFWCRPDLRERRWLTFQMISMRHPLKLCQNKAVATMGGAAQMLSMLPGMSGAGMDKSKISEVHACARAIKHI